MADQWQHQLFRGNLQAFHPAYGTMPACQEASFPLASEPAMAKLILSCGGPRQLCSA